VDKPNHEEQNKMAQTWSQALAAARITSDEHEYTYVRLPSAAITPAAAVLAEIGEPFLALIVDRHEVSLMLPSEDLAEFGRRLPEHQTLPEGYRLITFDVVLEPTLIGFMAHISAALAQANISILPFAAHSRDHLFVTVSQYQQAMDVLTKLQKEA
jgi:hypothetical protein